MVRRELLCGKGEFLRFFISRANDVAIRPELWAAAPASF